MRSFVLNWDVLLAQGFTEILPTGPFCSALRRLLSLWAPPGHSCLLLVPSVFALNTDIPTLKAFESTHACSLLDTVQILGPHVELWSV